MLELIALKEFRYNGKMREAGERFEASPRAAKIFKSRGKAKDAPALPRTVSPATTSAPRAAGSLLPADDQRAPAPRPQRRGGRYSRTDMRADD